MAQLSELNRIEINEAERVRTEIGVSQKFLCECLNVHPTSWSNWKGEGKIPDKYHEDILRLFITLKQFKSGQRLAPIAENGDTPQSDLLSDLPGALDVLLNVVENSVSNKVVKSTIRQIITSMKSNIQSVL